MPQDSRLLASPDWQRQVANSIAQAVDDFFAKRGQRAPERRSRLRQSSCLKLVVSLR